MEKEKRFIKIIENNRKIKLEPNIWFHDSGDWLFEINNSYIWINYPLAWSIFEKEYNMNYKDVQYFMKDMLLIHLKIDKTTPITIPCDLPKCIDIPQN